MERLARTLAVVMERRDARSRWAGVIWQAASVLESDEPPGAARLLVKQDGFEQWLHPGFELALRKADSDGYYLNVSTPEPKVFVAWREEEDRAVPCLLTASYSEASSWMEGGEQVDPVSMPPDIFAWVGEFVEKYYRPEPKRRVRPQSFRHPKDRMRNG